MACEIAHEFGKQVATHSRSANSVKLSVRNGVDCIYHCEFADEEALDMMEAAKDRIFLGPGRRPAAQHGLRGRALGHHRRGGRADGHAAQPREDRRGLRRGQEARHPGRGRRRLRLRLDAAGHQRPRPQHFVNLFGYSPMEAHLCATRWGGELMRMGGELGQVREGYLADLLLVDGNPLQDIGDHGRPQPVRHDHEGRRDLQGPARPTPARCGSRRSRIGLGRNNNKGPCGP